MAKTEELSSKPREEAKKGCGSKNISKSQKVPRENIDSIVC